MNLVMNIFGRVVAPLFGTGIGRVPFVVPVYKWIWRNFGPRGIITVETNGYKLLVDYKDWAVAPSLAFSHTWEPHETAVVVKHLRRGMTVVDIGAHIGYYSLLMSRLIGDSGRVHSFEPSTSTRALLNQNVRINNAGNVTVYPYAITDHNHLARMYTDRASPASNSLWGKPRADSFIVEAHTLDTILGDLKIDFIKMDIEGGEAKALRGMARIINNSPKLMMLTEIYPCGLVRAGSSLEGYVEQLLRYFALFEVTSGGLVPTDLSKIKHSTKVAGVVNLLCIKKGE